MSDYDPRPTNHEHPSTPVQLPAIPGQNGNGAIGMPLPAAPWIDGGESKEGFNFLGFLHSLRRRWIAGLGIGFLVASACAMLLWLLVPVKYEAFVTIRVRRNQQQMLRDKFQRSQHPQDFEIEKQTQAALLKSPFVINAALRDEGINQMPLVRDEPWLWMGERDNKVAWLEKELKVQFAEGSEVLTLSMRERYPDQLKKLLNAVTDAYMNEIVYAERQDQVQKLDTLRERQRQISSKITDLLNEISELAKTYGSSQNENVKLQLDMQFDRLRALDRDRLSADQAFYEAYDMYRMQQQKLATNSMFQPKEWEIEDVLLSYPEYASLKAQYVELEQAIKLRGGQLRGGAASAGAGLQAQLSALQSQMEEFKYAKKGEAIERLRSMTNNDSRRDQQDLALLEARVRMAATRRQEAHKNYQTVSDQLREMGKFNADLTTRQMELDSLEDLQDKITQEIETVELEMSSKPQVVVVQRAIIPDESNWIMKYMQVIAAWGMALFGTILGVALWDMQYKRVNSSDEISEQGELRVIGSLPAVNSRRVGGLLPTSEEGRRRIAVGLNRSIDGIRTSLLFANGDQAPKVIVVTSALGQEGKTTVASQLAVSMARAGRRTLLIDGDVRNPQLHTVLGIPFEKGLSETLRGEITVDQGLKPTPLEGLWFLSAGLRDANTDQHLASLVLEQLLGHLRSQFDTIIIDTGPVLTSPDAMLLSRHADAALLSVRRDISRMPKVNEAANRLRCIGTNVIGCVLNGSRMDFRESELKLAPGGDPSAETPQLENTQSVQ